MSTSGSERAESVAPEEKAYPARLAEQFEASNRTDDHLNDLLDEVRHAHIPPEVETPPEISETLTVLQSELENRVSELLSVRPALLDFSLNPNVSVRENFDRICDPLVQSLWKRGQSGKLHGRTDAEEYFGAARDISALHGAFSACSHWRKNDPFDMPIPEFIRSQLSTTSVAVEELGNDWCRLSGAYAQNSANMPQGSIQTAVAGALIVWGKREELDDARWVEGRAAVLGEE